MVTLNSHFFELLLPGGVDKLDEGAVQPVRAQVQDGGGEVGEHLLVRVLDPPKQTCLS